jgi:hypothetical protein
MEQWKLGKLPPRFDKRTLNFTKYITSELPPPPDVMDYSPAVSKWGEMLNRKYGDCVVAAAGHLVQEWTANTGNEFIPTDNAIKLAYSHFVGDPDAHPDQGVNMLDFLIYWRGFGIEGHPVDSFAQVELKNNILVQDSVYLFGNCYIGLALPNFACPKDPKADWLKIDWVVPPKGPVGDAAPNRKNGHCVPIIHYDQRFFYVVTWGQIKTMTWQFYQAYADEAYAVLSLDWIRKTLGTSPPGFDLAALKADLRAIQGA